MSKSLSQNKPPAPHATPDPDRPAYDNPKTGPLEKDRQLPANLDGPLGPKRKEGD